MASLFQPAAQTDRHLKVLLHGGPGVGKSRAALSFPGRVAVIDLEGSTALYEGFDVLRTKNLAQIEAAIGEIAGDLTRHYATIVIDPLTVIWQLLQDAGQGLVDRRAGKAGIESGQALSPREWGLIKRKYSSILTRLNNLPCNVVLIARDTDLYEGTGDQLKRVGIKADVEKSTPYVADLVIRLEVVNGKRTAIVEKSRAAGLAVDQRLTGWPVEGFYAHCLAPALGPAPAPAAPAPLFEEDSAVVAGNATLLEAAQAPAAESSAPRVTPTVDAFRKRIGEHFTRLEMKPEQQQATINALTEGEYQDLAKIEDKALLRTIGLTLNEWRDQEDMARFWEEYGRAHETAGAA